MPYKSTCRQHLTTICLSDMKDLFIITDKVHAGGKLPPATTSAIREKMQQYPDGEKITVTISSGKEFAGAWQVLPLETIINDLALLQSMAQTSIEYTDVNQVLHLLNELSSWLPYAGKLQANAKLYWRQSEAAALGIIPDNLQSTSERQKWARANSAEFEALYQSCERVCAAMTHRCDHLRTFVSYEKTQIEANKTA